jgi:hypothetical protein
MDQAREKEPKFVEENVPFDQIVEKVKVIVQGSHGALFGKIVDSFFELSEPEYFSPEDLAAIEEGMRASLSGDRTQFIPWEEYKAKRDL